MHGLGVGTRKRSASETALLSVASISGEQGHSLQETGPHAWGKQWE